MDLGTWDICLVASPAGTGKTALLSQWYDELSQREGCVVFWVSLDANDASPLRFMRALAEAFSAFDTCFSEQAASLSDPSDAEALAITLINCGDAAFEDVEHAVVILDGYEQAASPELSEAIAYVNRYVADNVHLIVAGTYIPSALSDLALECEVLEFGTEDTRWDEQRLALLRKQLGLTADDIDAIGSYDLAQTPLGLSFIRYALDRADRREACIRDSARMLQAFLRTRTRGARVCRGYEAPALRVAHGYGECPSFATCFWSRRMRHRGLRIWSARTSS